MQHAADGALSVGRPDRLEAFAAAQCRVDPLKADCTVLCEDLPKDGAMTPGFVETVAADGEVCLMR
jgi:hypothetical protein